MDNSIRFDLWQRLLKAEYNKTLIIHYPIAWISPWYSIWLTGPPFTILPLFPVLPLHSPLSQEIIQQCSIFLKYWKCVRVLIEVTSNSAENLPVWHYQTAEAAGLLEFYCIMPFGISHLPVWQKPVHHHHLLLLW